MGSFAPLHAETFADRRRYLEDRMTQVACLDCLAQVRVRKASEHQTSIQWTDDAVAACAEFARARVEGGAGPPATCGRLRASIARAVEEGLVEVGGGVD